MDPDGIASLALVALTVNAADATPPGRPCSASEYRQFDFWIGSWDVYEPGDKLAGRNDIESIAGGCALLENWAGRGGFTGKSLNTWDSERRRWHQTWTDSAGSLLLLEGGLDGDRMVLGSEAADAAGVPGAVRQRIAWSRQADGSVRQLWETSTDGGKTWSVVFDGRYVRRK